jgi:hypothetical protein
MVKFEIRYGEDIGACCRRLVAHAEQHGSAEVDFNEIKLTAKPGDDPAALASYYTETSRQRHEAWLASPEYRAQQIAAAVEQQKRENALAAALAKAPEKPTMADPEGWAKFCKVNSEHPYSAGVVRYAEKWARLMEGQIEEGRTVAECADETSSLADDEGITGAMFGFAVGILSRVWKHGADLRAWHNRSR